MPNAPDSAFQTRHAALQARVQAAAQALLQQGIRPTVSRLRVALGGGSPNELAPALKAWRASEAASSEQAATASGARTVPAPIADLARELWTRAVAAATVDNRSGETALALVARSQDVELLRQQLAALQAQSDRDAAASGELRALCSRLDATARDALRRLQRAEQRHRQVLDQLAEARLRIVELEAATAVARPLKRLKNAKKVAPRVRPAKGAARKSPREAASAIRKEPKPRVKKKKGPSRR